MKTKTEDARQKRINKSVSLCCRGLPTPSSSSGLIRKGHVGFLQALLPCPSAVCCLCAYPSALLTPVLSSQTPETSCAAYRGGLQVSCLHPPLLIYQSRGRTACRGTGACQETCANDPNLPCLLLASIACNGGQL